MDAVAPKSRLCCAVIVLLALLAWGRTVGYGFVWDDQYFIVENQAIRSLKNIPAMFYSRVAEASTPGDFPNFRPLRNVAYAMLFKLGGGETPQPWIFHLANVLAHAAVSVLLFLTASLLFRQAGAGPARWMALLGAAGFAVHPAASETVCWAKSLDDLMAAAFVLAATREILLWKSERGRYVRALGLFALAIYAKESAVPFAGLVFFLFAGVHQLPWRKCLRLTAPFLLLGGFYAAHRALVLGQSAQCAPISGSYGQTLLDTVPAIAIYFRLLWGIPPFSIDYTEMRGGLHVFSPPVMAGTVLLMLWGVGTASAWRNEKFRPVAVGLLWLALFLLPVSNLLPMMQYLAERFLYLPLIGWVLALGALLLAAPKRPLRLGLMAALVAVWLPASLAREGIWRDEVTLFARSSLDNPKNLRLHENLVAAVFHLPHMTATFGLGSTATQMRIAHSIPPDDGEAILQTLTQAHELFPDEPRFTATLGITYALLGQTARAIPILSLAARQAGNDPEIWVDLGTAYSVEKDWGNARAAWETALRLSPTNQMALEHLRSLDRKP